MSNEFRIDDLVIAAVEIGLPGTEKLVPIGTKGKIIKVLPVKQRATGDYVVEFETGTTCPTRQNEIGSLSPVMEPSPDENADDSQTDPLGKDIDETPVMTAEEIDEMLVMKSTPKLVQMNETCELVNWIIPIGSGDGMFIPIGPEEGMFALTLDQSTRTSPYIIQSLIGPDGTTLYYLSDSNSIATYGQIERVVQFDNISPLTNNADDIEHAANSLYDAAVAWLDQHKMIQDDHVETAMSGMERIAALEAEITSLKKELSASRSNYDKAVAQLDNVMSTPTTAATGNGKAVTDNQIEVALICNDLVAIADRLNEGWFVHTARISGTHRVTAFMIGPKQVQATIEDSTVVPSEIDDPVPVQLVADEFVPSEEMLAMSPPEAVEATVGMPAGDRMEALAGYQMERMRQRLQVGGVHRGKRE